MSAPTDLPLDEMEAAAKAAIRRAHEHTALSRTKRSSLNSFREAWSPLRALVLVTEVRTLREKLKAALSELDEAHTAREGAGCIMSLAECIGGLDDDNTALRKRVRVLEAERDEARRAISDHLDLSKKQMTVWANRAEAAEQRAREIEEDKARLDFLDRLNVVLNKHYGTTYRWKLITTHNVNRLMLGDMSVDLHDSEPSTGLVSCRDAIDIKRKEAEESRRAAQALKGDDR